MVQAYGSIPYAGATYLTTHFKTTRMEKNKSAEDFVKEHYEDAFCDCGDVDDYTCSYWITTPKLDKDHLSLCVETTSEAAAWTSAANRIREQLKQNK